MTEEVVELQEGALVEFEHKGETMRGTVEGFTKDERARLKGENGRSYVRDLDQLAVIEEELAPPEPASQPQFEEATTDEELVDVKTVSVNCDRATRVLRVVGFFNDGRQINLPPAPRPDGKQLRIRIDWV